MKKENFVLPLIAVLILLAGCAAPLESKNPNLTDEQVAQAMDQLANDSPYPPVYDPDAVCPFECCKNEERYYDKRCAGRSTCVDNNCVLPEPAPNETPQARILADNEVYPGVFIEILGAKQITQRIKEPEERYGLVGQYVMDEKRDGVVYGYQEGKKLIVVELTVENKGLDAEYSREDFDAPGLQFYVANSAAERYPETHAPPEDHAPITVYYSDIPQIKKGEKKEAFIAFLVPSDFAYQKLIMEEKLELYGFDPPIIVDREIEFTIG